MHYQTKFLSHWECDITCYFFDDLKVGSFFSGIGAFEKALDMLQEDLRDGKKPFFVMKEE